MKVVALLLSIIVFGVAGYYFAIDFKNSNELNYVIYMGMLLILMSICIVIIMITIPFIIYEKRKMSFFLYTKFSKKKRTNGQERILRLKKHNYALKEEPKFQDMV